MPMLEKDVEDTERMHATLLRQSADVEGVINRYLALITSLRN